MIAMIYPQNPTTSFLTATTLKYAIGGGITAAAGTRIALQLFFIDNGFKLFSFQLPDLLSHSQFPNEEHSYLNMHGFIFETSI